MKIREGMFQSYEFSCIALEHAFLFCVIVCLNE